VIQEITKSASSKLNYFHEFIEFEENSGEMIQLCAKRIMIKEKITTGTHAWKQKRWIVKERYGGDAIKAETVLKKIKSQEGFTARDKYLPDDDEEMWYFIETEKGKIDEVQKISEEVSGSVTLNDVDKNTVA